MFSSTKQIPKMSIVKPNQHCVALCNYVSLCITLSFVLSLFVTLRHVSSLCVTFRHVASLCVIMRRFASLCVALRQTNSVYCSKLSMCEQHRQCHCIQLSTGVCCLFKKMDPKKETNCFFVLIMLKPNQTNKSYLQINHERGGGHLKHS
jgi:hypothetical protein